MICQKQCLTAFIKSLLMQQLSELSDFWRQSGNIGPSNKELADIGYYI